MPIYEYMCAKCGHQKEVLQKFSDPPIARCDRCQGKMKKLISPSTFHLKGTGWYVTDYASKSGSAKKQATDSKGEKPAAKGETKGSTESSAKKDSSTSSTTDK